MTQTLEMMKGFSDLVLTFWLDFSVLCFAVNKPFSSLLGTKLLDFIRDTSKIVFFLKNIVVQTDALNGLCKGTSLWEANNTIFSYHKKK